MDADEIVSVLTGEPINVADGYITDAEGNHYTVEEYSIEVDRATGPEGDLSHD